MPYPIAAVRGGRAVIANQGLGFVVSIAPTLGAELISNGEFATNTTGWNTTDVSIARVDSESDPGANSGGADKWALKVTKTLAGFTTRANQAIASLTAGKWCIATARIYSPSANNRTNAALFSFLNSITAALPTTTVEDTWTAVVATARSTGALTLLLSVQGNILNDLAYFDMVSIKEITFATMLATPRTGLATDNVTANLTGAVGHLGGVVRNLDSISNPQNFILAYTGNNKAYLEKVVGGSWVAPLINGLAITEVANGKIEIRNTAANTFQLWYNGAQVGTDQTISDAGIVSNTLFAQFATGSGVTFSGFSVSPL